MKKRKKDIEQDWEQNYTLSQVRTVLKIHGLDYKDFSDWIYGQTCPVIIEDGVAEAGVYGYDLWRYLQWKLEGKEPIWD